MKLRAFVMVLAGLLAGCSGGRPEPVFHADENPPRLSDWGAVAVRDGRLVLGEGVLAYDLNTPLFTDYAHKLRTVWSPGAPAPYQEESAFDLPVGTVITKTFYYPEESGRVLKAASLTPMNAARGLDLSRHRLIETRVLVRRADGWHAVSYLWDEDESDAALKRTGAVVPLTMAGIGESREFSYIVPDTNQCAACHAHDATAKRIEPLGPRAGQLNRPYRYAEGEGNQLARWVRAGLIAPPPAAPRRDVAWDDPAAPLDARARSYLQANCAHCHNPSGPADTSGLDLTFSADGAALGRCKPPIAAGSGTGGRRFGIVPGAPGESILNFRVASDDPAAMMPEFGRSLVHEEGRELLDAWVAAMTGTCG